MKRENSVILFSMVTCILGIIVMGILGTIMQSFGVTEREADIVSRVMVSVVIIIVTWKMGLFNRSEYKLNNLGKNIGISWVIFLVQAMLLAMVLYDTGWEFKSISVKTIVLMITSNMAIGLFEEVLMRGLILNKLLSAWGHKQYGVAVAVFVSSLMFGMLHIFNYLSDSTLLIATITQIIYATFAGVFFAVLYLKTKSIWLIAFLHGLTDIISDIGVTLSKTPVGNGEITLERGLLMLVIMCPLMIWGCYNLRYFIVFHLNSTTEG